MGVGNCLLSLYTLMRMGASLSPMTSPVLTRINMKQESIHSAPPRTPTVSILVVGINWPPHRWRVCHSHRHVTLPISWMLLRDRKCGLLTLTPLRTKLLSSIIAEWMSEIDVPITSSVQELKLTATASANSNANNIFFILSI